MFLCFACITSLPLLVAIPFWWFVSAQVLYCAPQHHHSSAWQYPRCLFPHYGRTRKRTSSFSESASVERTILLLRVQNLRSRILQQEKDQRGRVVGLTPPCICDSYSSKRLDGSRRYHCDLEPKVCVQSQLRCDSRLGLPRHACWRDIGWST